MIRRPAAILTLLTGLNLLNYLDRLVVSAVLPRIEGELHLSHLQAGVLATVFLVGYFVTAPFFGSLGDRRPRKGLIAIGVAIWSAATIASGLATGFLSLIVARIFVGVGEASYATLAPTIIDDLTDRESKGRALAIFYAAAPVGGALGFLVGGKVESVWGWRSAFFVAGGPGLALALLCLAIAEPARKVATEKADILRDLRALFRVRLYRQGVLGYCAQTFAIGGFSYWAPTFLVERYKMALPAANFRFGIITVVAGAIGTFVGGRWADGAQRRASDDDGRVKALLRVCAVGSLVGGPLAAAGFLAPSPAVFFALVFVSIGFLFLVTAPINAVILQAVPAQLRASAMALSIFAIHALGDLWSPPLVGFLADSLPIALAMMALPLAILVSAGTWWPRRPSVT